jgi:hypothetical protein
VRCSRAAGIWSWREKLRNLWRDIYRANLIRLMDRGIGSMKHAFVAQRNFLSATRGTKAPSSAFLHQDFDNMADTREKMPTCWPDRMDGDRDVGRILEHGR